ncbi:FAD-binding oxidoreductase [Thalassobaculum sp. OXR-137]|uniref:NAD(P)/FAD-dependent oxidoreductase n=1 Tax=Thalassobaculum sp. OXR-137 TaxID=3100173 RepID=UPI002AC9A8C6|nr:FAD-binding oxidoreductase [Thalassobaculum sp. OXR-137]WPZ35968.1 FAD-binding oxidoreductase [Thalassobaculum sp. OXR-137]
MTKADVIVIGGGIAGITAGACLARDLSVLVLEGESRIGYHATGRSAAILIRNYGNATLRALNLASAPFLEAPQEVSDDSLLSPRGEMLVAGEDELPDLEAYVDGATGMEILTGAQARELVPILRAEAIVKAAIEWDAQDIDVDRMLSGYARLLRRRGGVVETDVTVRDIRRESGHWKITSDRETYSAAIVINAAGAWAGGVGRMAGATDIALSPLRRTAAILPAPEAHDISRWPLFAPATEAWYAKPEAGKLLVSPADEDPVEPHDAWADDMVLAEGLDRFERAVDYTVSRVETSWAGLRTFAPDRTPVVGMDPGADGFFWLAGQGGYGVQTAPALSTLTAEMILGGPTSLKPEIVAALSPSRFA